MVSAQGKTFKKSIREVMCNVYPPCGFTYLSQKRLKLRDDDDDDCLNSRVRGEKNNGG